MQRVTCITVAILMVVLLISGCGKSDMEKKMETELNATVTKLHEEGMKLVKTFPELQAKIGMALSAHDSLGKLYPKLTEGHSSADLIAAKEKLAAAGTAMDTWMKEHKKYDEKMKHVEAITLLNKEKDDLTKITGQATAAVDAAKTALASHAQFAQDLMAKIPGKKKK
jgi:hypothetical protein